MSRATRILVGGSIAISATALAACGGSSGGQTKTASLAATDGPTTTGVCAADPVRGGDLVYERQAETQGLNPTDARNGNGDIFADNLVYSGLVRPDPDGGSGVKPALADRWTTSPDGKTYTFHLRPGVKFSNGDPVTPEDVKFSLDRFGDPKINAALSAVAVGYGSTSVVDDSTVKVTLKQPVASFLTNISIFPAFIVPKKLVQEQGSKFWSKPVGTGPFTVQEFARGSHITFQRNPNYWEAGKPYLNSVRFNFATDSNSRLLAVRNGQAQIADGVPFSQIGSLRQDKALAVQSTKVPLFLGLWLNHDKAPLADLQVRKAMQSVINRQQIKQSIFRGLGTIPNSVLMALRFDAPDSVVKPYPYDVAKAKQYMSQSKYPDGFSTTLQYPAGYDYYKQLALLLQQEMAQIGIKVKLIEEDGATGTTRFTDTDYDMTFPFASFTSDVVVPDEYASFLADPDNGLKGFFSNWKDPAIQKMVQTFTQTIDESQRAQQWPKIQQALLDQTPVINVMNLPFVNVHSATTCGTKIDGLGSDLLAETWLGKGAS